MILGLFDVIVFVVISSDAGIHHNFSLLSLISVIQHAGNKRSSQGPMGNRLSTNMQDYSGRPSSTQSVVPGKLHRKPSTAWCVCILLISCVILEMPFTLQCNNFIFLWIYMIRAFIRVNCTELFMQTLLYSLCAASWSPVKHFLLYGPLTPSIY